MLVYGRNSVLSILGNPNRKVQKIFVTNDNKRYLPILYQSCSKLSIVYSHYITNLINQSAANHQGFLVHTLPLAQPDIQVVLNTLGTNVTVIVLDRITNPQNIGAIFRIAAAFGVKAIISLKKFSPSENLHIIKASAGAFDVIPYIRVSNISNIVNVFKKKKYWVFALDINGSYDIDILQKNYPKKVLVLGSEGFGIKPNVLKKCDFSIKIRTSTLVKSLNVSNALAIGLHTMYVKKTDGMPDRI